MFRSLCSATLRYRTGASGAGGITSASPTHAGSTSLPLFDTFGSVHEARLKQHGRRFPLPSFEMLTLIRRLRVSEFPVALTQRTHSHRAIGVMSSHRSRISAGAAASAAPRSFGTLGSGQSLRGSILSVAESPTLMWAVRRSFSSTLIQCPELPSGSSTVWNSWPLIVPCTATCPRDGSFSLAFCGSRRIVRLRMVTDIASKRIADTPARGFTVIA
jgi:hypothetical protein